MRQRGARRIEIRCKEELSGDLVDGKEGAEEKGQLSKGGWLK